MRTTFLRRSFFWSFFRAGRTRNAQQLSLTCTGQYGRCSAPCYLRVCVCVKNITHTPRATQKTERSETEASAADAAATVAVTALLSMRQCCCCCLLQKKNPKRVGYTPSHTPLPSPALPCPCQQVGVEKKAGRRAAYKEIYLLISCAQADHSRHHN